MVDYVYTDPNLKAPSLYGPPTVADMVFDFLVGNTSTYYTSGTGSFGTGATTLSTASVPCNSVLVQNDPASTVNIYVGTSTAQTIEIVPGDSETLPVQNLADVYVRAKTGTATVNWQTRG